MSRRPGPQDSRPRCGLPYGSCPRTEATSSRVGMGCQRRGNTLLPVTSVVSGAGARGWPECGWRRHKPPGSYRLHRAPRCRLLVAPASRTSLSLLGGANFGSDDDPNPAPRRVPFILSPPPWTMPLTSDNNMRNVAPLTLNYRLPGRPALEQHYTAPCRGGRTAPGQSLDRWCQRNRTTAPTTCNNPASPARTPPPRPDPESIMAAVRPTCRPAGEGRHHLVQEAQVAEVR